MDRKAFRFSLNLSPNRIRFRIHPCKKLQISSLLIIIFPWNPLVNPEEMAFSKYLKFASSGSGIHNFQKSQKCALQKSLNTFCPEGRTVDVGNANC